MKLSSLSERKNVDQSEGMYWVGAKDPNIKVFDIIMESKFGTTYNAYLIIGSEKTALIDTVKEKFFNTMFEKITKVLKGRKLDYLIHNHTKPDHAGSSESIIKKFPEVQVVASSTALEYLNSMWSEEISSNVKTLTAITEVTSIDLGGLTLSFHEAKFLHWPDSIFTFCPEKKALFTCDVFGTHFTHKDKLFADEITGKNHEVFEKEFTYYVKCIFSPFKKYVLKGMDVFDNLKKKNGVNFVFPSHGPMYRDEKNILRIVRKYKEMSVAKKEKFEKKVTILYVSAYGFTEKIAKNIAKGIESKGIKVKLFDELSANKKTLCAEIRSSKCVLFGSPTINSDVLPNIWKYLTHPYFNPISSQGQIAGSFGSFGWSGEASSNIDERLQQLKLNVPLEPLKVRFKGKKNDVKACIEYGEKIGRVVKGEKINERILRRSKKKVNFSLSVPNDGRMRLWKCILCGETIVSKLRPKICYACSNDDPDIWECVKIIYDNSGKPLSSYEGTIAIVGGGSSGIAAAKAIRKNNSTCKVLLFSEEGKPYYRPTVTKLRMKYVEDDFFDTSKNGVTLISEKVTHINDEKKKLTVASGKEFSWDKIILCTGGKAAKIFPSAKNVFTIYSPNDVDNILSYVDSFEKKKGRVIVVGSGLLGIEISEILLHKKKDKIESITMIEKLDKILPFQLDETANEVLKKTLNESGIDVKLSHDINTFLIEDECAKKVIFKNAKSIECDLICVAVGSTREMDLPKQLKLKMGRIVIVNDRMETSKKDIYCAGSIAQFGFFCIPNYANAVLKGEVAGLNCIGIDTKFVRDMSPYALNSFGLQISSCGKVHCKISLNRRNFDKYVKLSFKKDKEGKVRLCGYILVGPKVSKVSKSFLSAVQNGVEFCEAWSLLESF